MTAPLTPPDCDLQHLPFMPLHVARLRDSDLAAEESPEACWYAVLLWAASWHQVPAASLPDNDAVLAKLAGLGRDQKTWRKHRAAALRGFVLCDDGRLYHPVVAEQAVAAYGRSGEWGERQENRTSRQQRWRDRCKALAGQLRDAGITPPQGASLKTLEEMVARLPGETDVDAQASTVDAYRDAPEMPLTGTGTGTVDSDPDGSAVSSTSGVDPLAELKAQLAEDPKGAAWRLALKVLMDRGGFPRSRAATVVGKWQKDGAAPIELWQAAEAAWANRTLEPVGYITEALKGIRNRAADANFDPMLQPEDWRQRRWMEEFVEGQFPWDPRRGPRPGEPGCRVAPAIQRELGVEPAAPQPVRGAA